jgi:hypothetical protein
VGLPYQQGELETKQVALITLLNEIYFVVSHDTDIPAVERVAIRNLITSTNESVNILFNVRALCAVACFSMCRLVTRDWLCEAVLRPLEYVST